MKLLKAVLVLFLVLGVSYVPVSNVYAVDETSDLILKLLIKKGVLSQKDVDDLKTEVKEVAPDQIHATFHDALQFKTEDGQHKLKIDGRLHVDSMWMNRHANLKAVVGESNADAELRRAYLGMSGTFYNDYIYKLQVDFAGGDVDFKDAYVGLKNIPYIGTFRIGHIKEPFSLEEMISSKYITFINKAAMTVFAPGRNIGVDIRNTAYDQRLHWNAGIYRDADNYGNVTQNEYDFTGRVTGLPYYEDGGKKLVHLGAAYSFRQSDDVPQYSEAPENHMANDFVDTGVLPLNHAQHIGYEAALVYGPLSVQGEYAHAIVDQWDGASNTYLHGFYTMASYFLTGEHRPYSKSSGRFSRVRPKNNFSIKDRTWGAWELAGRFSYLDFNDDNVQGRIMSISTAGLNWYLTPNIRLMGNYSYSNLNHAGGANTFITRCQVDF